MFNPILRLQQKSESAVFLWCCISFAACLLLSTDPYCTHSKASPAPPNWMNFQKSFRGLKELSNVKYLIYFLCWRPMFTYSGKNEIRAFSCLWLLSPSFFLLFFGLFSFFCVLFCLRLLSTSFPLLLLLLPTGKSAALDIKSWKCMKCWKIFR